MCGIAGIFAYKDPAPSVSLEELLRIRDAMVARGPDGAGAWLSENRRLGFAHRRLSIIDLSDRATQPMTTVDENLVITFNGEIYNYREIRGELEKKGFQFRSESDTEVLLNLYADRGAEMLQSLRGMYAFAIWDRRKQELFLARDAFGIKPLYYVDDGRTLRFASQVKALIAGGSIDLSPSYAGHVGFFLWGNVPEPFTLYTCIRSLPAGTYLTLRIEQSVEVRAFFSISSALSEVYETGACGDSGVRGGSLAKALRDSVRHHLLADVPVGIFLSAGIDSTVLAGLAAEERNAVRAVTLGFEEYRGTTYDEVPLARVVAKSYEMHQTTMWLSREEFLADLENVLFAMDQPSIDGVNTYFVSKLAASQGLKVAISGLGGDELFQGYPSFWQVPRLVRWMEWTRHVPSMGKYLRVMADPIVSRLTSPKYAGLFEYGNSYGGAYLLRRGVFMPWELGGMLAPEVVREGLGELETLVNLEGTVRGIRSQAGKIAALELSWYLRNQLLRDADWAGMAHSVEIRVPYIDLPVFNEVVGSARAGMPYDKSAVAKTPTKPLPVEILSRRKSGFAVPVDQWLQEGRKDNSSERGLRGWARKVHGSFGGVDLT